MTGPGRVLVVGTGLIGTSVGLALRDTADVLLSDTDPAHLEQACSRGAGRPWDGSRPIDLALVCVPPARTAEVVTRVAVSGVASTVSHVASRQAQVQREVERELTSSSTTLARVCGGHPVAGRETSGPASARADLFAGRPWAVCPGAGTSPAAVTAVRALAEACGAMPVLLAPDEHDEAMALVSHLPQVVSSALAARLLDPGGRPAEARALAGPGLQDTTRVAASDPDLWLDVLTGNAAAVAPLVEALASDLHAVARALATLAQDADDGAAALVVRSLLERGRRGRAELPLKDRQVAGGLDAVVVSLPDRPGQLAGVLSSAAAAGINVEDLRVEHLPGRPRGLLELLVPASAAATAREALAAAGWDVVGR